MNFFKNLFGNKKATKEEGSEEAKPEQKVETATGAGCDCTGCPSSGCCPGEEMKKAVEEEEK